MTDNKSFMYCSFCGQRQDKVGQLIKGPKVYICNVCVEKCHNLLVDSKGSKKTTKLKDGEIPSPSAIKELLDKYVIGQDYAKIVVSVAVHNHYKRIMNPVIDNVEIDKNNIMLIGPSGVGKTLIAQTVARMLNVPFTICDATSLTESGYVGDDVESIIGRLVVAAGGDVSKAEQGIVYLDEVDKKAKKGESVNISRDVTGEGVQQALLKIIEGSEVRVSPQGGKKHPMQEMVTVNTKNILFICGGAFVGIDEIIRQRMNKDKVGIGFGSMLSSVEENKYNDVIDLVESDDLIRFGLIPEFVGRLPVIAPLRDLTEEQLVTVLSTPQNSIIKQYQKMFSLENVELEFTDDALASIAHHGIERKTGARGLRSVVEKVLIKTQFDLVDLAAKGLSKVTVTNDSITKLAPPLYQFREEIGDPELVDTGKQSTI